AIDDRRITLNVDALFDNPSDLTLTRGMDSAFKTLLHEYVHAVTLSAYRNPRTQADRDFKRFIDSSYRELRGDAQLRKSLYGFSSPTEFIAELMSSGEFRQLAPLTRRNIWQRVVDFIK